MVDFDQRTEFRRNEICIIGAGPAGLSAAAHCAELGIAYVLLDIAQDFAIAEAAMFIQPGERGLDRVIVAREPRLRDPSRVVAGLGR